MSRVRITTLSCAILILLLPVITSGSAPPPALRSDGIWYEGVLKLGTTIQVVTRVRNESMFEDSIYVHAYYESALHRDVRRGDTGLVIYLEYGQTVLVRLPITITEPGEFRVHMGTYRWEWPGASLFPRGHTQTLLLQFEERGNGRQVQAFAVPPSSSIHSRRRPAVRRVPGMRRLITDPDSLYKSNRYAESAARYRDSFQAAGRIRDELAIARSDVDFDLNITGDLTYGSDDTLTRRDYNAAVCPFEGDRMFLLQLGLHLPMNPRTWRSTSAMLRARVQFPGGGVLPDTGVYNLKHGELILTHQKLYPHPRWTNFFKYATYDGHMRIDRTTRDSVFGVVVFFARMEDYVLRRITTDFREPPYPSAIHVSARFAVSVTSWPAHPIVDLQRRRVHSLRPPRS